MFKNPHFQTIVSGLIPHIGRLYSTQHTLKLPDQDEVYYYYSGNVSAQNIAILLHGLSGSAHSRYMKRLASKLVKKKYGVVRLAFRNFGPKHARAKNFPHAGRTESTLACIEHIHQKYPQASLVLIGFSMGGNIALKLAGEQSNYLKQCGIDKIISISPPTDLAKCANLLDKPTNKLYRYYFISSLNKMIKYRHQQFPELGPHKHFRLNTGMWAFDQAYTAPQGGFKSAADYYQRASAKSALNNISIPTHIFASLDDPFIDLTSLQYVENHPHIQITRWPFGGHMGCLGNPFRRSHFFWMDNEIITAL